MPNSQSLNQIAKITVTVLLLVVKMAAPHLELWRGLGQNLTHHLPNDERVCYCFTLVNLTCIVFPFWNKHEKMRNFFLITLFVVHFRLKRKCLIIESVFWMMSFLLFFFKYKIGWESGFECLPSITRDAYLWIILLRFDRCKLF